MAITDALRMAGDVPRRRRPRLLAREVQRQLGELDFAVDEAVTAGDVVGLKRDVGIVEVEGAHLRGERRVVPAARVAERRLDAPHRRAPASDRAVDHGAGLRRDVGRVPREVLGAAGPAPQVPAAAASLRLVAPREDGLVDARELALRPVLEADEVVQRLGPLGHGRRRRDRPLADEALQLVGRVHLIDTRTLDPAVGHGPGPGGHGPAGSGQSPAGCSLLSRELVASPRHGHTLHAAAGMLDRKVTLLVRRCEADERAVRRLHHARRRAQAARRADEVVRIGRWQRRRLRWHRVLRRLGDTNVLVRALRRGLDERIAGRREQADAAGAEVPAGAVVATQPHVAALAKVDAVRVLQFPEGHAALLAVPDHEHRVVAVL
eukprot:262490-Prymnesium_polylepis.1